MPAVWTRIASAIPTGARGISTEQSSTTAGGLQCRIGTFSHQFEIRPGPVQNGMLKLFY